MNPSNVRTIRFVRITQLYNGPCEHVNDVPDTAKHETEPTLHWGTIIYTVQEDGSLKYLKSDVDSSD